MKLCILDNDVFEGPLVAAGPPQGDYAPLGVRELHAVSERGGFNLAERYTNFGVMFERLFESVGAGWTYDIFNTVQGQYPASFDGYDAVLLTGSESDSF